MGSRKGLGWLGGDEREREVELGAGANGDGGAALRAALDGGARGARWLRRFIAEALRLGARRDEGETPAGRNAYGDGQRGRERAQPGVRASGRNTGRADSADSWGASACVPVSGGPQPREARPRATQRA
jgi:hypothetical protein